ncbi:Ppx/GppA phosphatase family protein [Paenibacillus rigui]|uniref:Phosphatase n=1 Tax=Paenibacillus rigui TaxID=554312 RepID=A0A229ULD3_9BACL|nr:Ppx/GppA phosphatase family protein [Paenibacillus rigui]OXM84277.1 phosphatase [Paenibacillus rigui]
MPINRRIGIIDIGSNSIRLVIYELFPTLAYRVIGEFKQSARLSQKIGDDNVLPTDDIDELIQILKQFHQICTAYEVTDMRAAATAAIRNASNSRQIIDLLRLQTGIHVELLSGEDEARVGFLGMMHALDISDGMLVDIGGGSTEVSVFRNRERLHSVSFPFGAVNTTRKFSNDGNFTDEQLRCIRQMVLQAVEGEPWIQQHPGLPLVGLGGTIRSLSKITQKKRKYSLPVTHNYSMSAEDMDEWMKLLPSLPADKRKKVDGLSKDRYDIIVPGLTILHTLFEAASASHYVISGAGLRDGLFQESYLSASPDYDTSLSLVERSVYNLLGLHSTAPAAHLHKVAEHALSLFDALREIQAFDERTRQLLHCAALLYRIGVAINYYQYAKHSFTLITQARLDGLSHRETLLVASIASFKTKSRVQQTVLQHKDILLESDVDLIVRLGTLLQLAIASDHSETQAVASLDALVDSAGKELQLSLQTKSDPSVEIREIAALSKDLKKSWNVKLTLHVNGDAGASSSRT